MNPAGPLKLAYHSFSEFWARRDGRERSMLTAAAVVIVFAIIYALLIAPALTGRKQLSKDLPLLRQQVAQMQALSKQAEALSGMPVTSVTVMSRENIEASLVRHGLKLQSLLLTGDYAKVKLGSVSFSGTLSWLEEMQKSSRISVVDASIAALDQPDLVDATMTLSQVRNE
jgi:general secretion pathway protein M